ncbi:MAG: glycoside hydrolase family 2, partial [Bacteroidetes bacterium]|nr:glycoside hydrolase family 2 [Bacteroidota bacterium]
LLLNFLTWAPKGLNVFEDQSAKRLLSPDPHYHYIYRVNCGGDSYEENGHRWAADRIIGDGNTWGSSSCANRFPGLPPFFASQRSTADFIQGTADPYLFQTFRYGRQDLRYSFPLPDGDYRVELYFAEPWIRWKNGVGGRGFDVAVNDKTVLKDLDIFKEAGHDHALKKVVNVHISGGKLVISFPRVAAGQAIISAIAIASVKKIKAAPAVSPLIESVYKNNTTLRPHDWMSEGYVILRDNAWCISKLPPPMFGATWLQWDGPLAPVYPPMVSFRVNRDAVVYIGVDSIQTGLPAGMKDFTDTKSFLVTSFSRDRIYRVWSKKYNAGSVVRPGFKEDALYPAFIVAAQPASNIEPAYDLKSVTGYKAINATVSTGIIKETINGKPAMVFHSSAGDTLQWSIHTGVADLYSLTIRYSNSTAQPLTARLQLLDESNHLLHEETVQLSPSLPGKWSYLNSSTGTVVNAGNYRLRLIAVNAASLAIDGLDVQ